MKHDIKILVVGDGAYMQLLDRSAVLFLFPNLLQMLQLFLDQVGKSSLISSFISDCFTEEVSICYCTGNLISC